MGSIHHRYIRIAGFLTAGCLFTFCYSCGTAKRFSKRKQPQTASHSRSSNDSTNTIPMLAAGEYDSSLSRKPKKLISPRNAKSVVMVEKGKASWYGPDFNGMLTANGEVYDMHGLTAAHRTLPFNTLVLVKNTSNGKSVVVRITDRGPFSQNRIIDLSKKAARKIGMLQNGTAQVKLYVAKKALAQPDSTNFATPTYTIQIGSFKDKEAAYHLSAKVEGSRVEIVQVNNQLRYRVYYGLYASTKSARKAQKILQGKNRACFIQQIENFQSK